MQNRNIPLEEPEAASDAPMYLQTEAKRVAELVLCHRTARSICFAALSDMHYPLNEAGTRRSIRDACMGVTELRKYIPLDFLGLLGDYVAGDENSTKAETVEGLQRVHKLLYPAGLGLPQIWLQGNHDRNPFLEAEERLNPDEMYAYIGASNTHSTVDPENPERMYGYMDFEAQRIRVIHLNSSDTSGAAVLRPHTFSPAQLRWLAETALVLRDKKDPAAWGIILLSHMPLYWQPHGILELVEGFLDGQKGFVAATEGEQVPFDFTGRDRAELICCINGHTHNFISSRLCGGRLLQISVPQLCDGRYNEYGTSRPADGGELDGEGRPIYHYKEADTARSTSFNVILADRKTRKVHAFCFGAGIDRTFDY